MQLVLLSPSISSGSAYASAILVRVLHTGHMRNCSLLGTVDLFPHEVHVLQSLKLIVARFLACWDTSPSSPMIAVRTSLASCCSFALNCGAWVLSLIAFSSSTAAAAAVVVVVYGPSFAMHVLGVAFAAAKRFPCEHDGGERVFR